MVNDQDSERLIFWLQDSDFLYLTGIDQQAVAVVEASSPMRDANFTLYVPDSDPQVCLRCSTSVPSPCCALWLASVLSSRFAVMENGAPELYTHADNAEFCWAVRGCRDKACDLYVIRWLHMQDATWNGSKMNAEAAAEVFGADEVYHMSEVGSIAGRASVMPIIVADTLSSDVM